MSDCGVDEAVSGATRRTLITGTMAAAVAGVLGAGATGAHAAGEAPARDEPRYALPQSAYRIDLHSHFLPPDYVAHLQRHGVFVVSWSADAHIAFMDRVGIQKSVVSAPQEFHFGDLGETRAVARGVNDAGRALLDHHGDRFAVHVTLPLPDIAASIAELSYGFDTLGLDGGVMLYSHYDGVYLGDPAYEDLYRELDRRRCVVWVHPSFPNKVPGPFPGQILEFPFETTRAAANLIYRGVLARYPNIRWQLSHAGGTLPFLLHRLGLMQTLPFSGLGSSPIPGPFASAKEFYYDTGVAGSAEQLLALQSLTGPGHVVFGTDWPFTATLFAQDAKQRWPWFSDQLPRGGDPEPALSSVFTRPQRLQIERANALELYPGLVRSRNSSP
jgi:predicted TIM-barrel fold metal-dependent hydrolase